MTGPLPVVLLIIVFFSPIAIFSILLPTSHDGPMLRWIQRKLRTRRED